MKKWLLWFLAGVIVGAVLMFVFLPSGGPDSAYWVARAEYEQEAASWEAERQESFRILAERDEVIRVQDEIVATSRREAARLEGEVVALRRTDAAQTAELRELRTAEVEELMERYPALKAYDLAKDRLLATKDGLIFTLTQQGAEKDETIEAQAVEIVQLKYNYADMKRDWKREHALRLVSDGLRHDLESKYRTSKFWKAFALLSNLAWGGAAIL